MTIINHKPVGLFATEVRADQQLDVLKRYLGLPGDRIEGEIYGLMRRLSPTFQQGVWRLYEVSNGSIYLAPCIESVGIHVERTSFAATLSGDAAGVVVSLLGLREAYRTWGKEELCTALIRLRDFAQQHAERDAILAATD
ncbi:MAG: antirestriction protein [Gammaproteobacteria bacterium]